MCLHVFSHSAVSDSLQRHDCSPPGSSVHRITQARILGWAAISSPRGPSGRRDQTCVSCVACTCRQILYHYHHLGSRDCDSHFSLPMVRKKSQITTLIFRIHSLQLYFLSTDRNKTKEQALLDWFIWCGKYYYEGVQQNTKPRCEKPFPENYPR